MQFCVAFVIFFVSIHAIHAFLHIPYCDSALRPRNGYKLHLKTTPSIVLLKCQEEGKKEPSEKWPIESEPYDQGPNAFSDNKKNQPKNNDSNFLMGRSLFDVRPSNTENDPIRQAEVAEGKSPNPSDLRFLMFCLNGFRKYAVECGQYLLSRERCIQLYSIN